MVVLKMDIWVSGPMFLGIWGKSTSVNTFVLFSCSRFKEYMEEAVGRSKNMAS